MEAQTKDTRERRPLDRDRNVNELEEDMLE